MDMIDSIYKFHLKWMKFIDRSFIRIHYIGYSTVVDFLGLLCVIC